MIVLTVATAAFAQKAAEKPRVPAGVDPGGIAVAVIGNGIDYTRPQIAARLARDGEGEIIGWDFIDNDRRPHLGCTALTGEQPCLNELLADAVGSLSKTRLITYRVSMAKPQTLVQAVQAAIQTPARVVLVATFPPPPATFLQEAASRHPKLLFVGVVAAASGEVAAANGMALVADPSESLLATLTAASAAGLAFGAAEVMGRKPEVDAAALKQLLAQVKAPGSSGILPEMQEGLKGTPPPALPPFPSLPSTPR